MHHTLTENRTTSCVNNKAAKSTYSLVKFLKLSAPTLVQSVKCACASSKIYFIVYQNIEI